MVCPNCAATLDTHCGRRNRLDREQRRCLRCGEEFWPSYDSQRYCSRYCGSRYARDGQPKPDQRKVVRPPHERLLIEITVFGYRGTGRRYGVSDNAVRKWLRRYEHDQTEATQRGDTPALE